MRTNKIVDTERKASGSAGTPLGEELCNDTPTLGRNAHYSARGRCLGNDAVSFGHATN